MMRKLAALVLYTALALGANTATFAAAQAQDVTSLLSGDMKKLVVHAEPKPVAEAVLITANETEVAFADWRGKWVVLNFWATWCAPCRKEMPSLDRLQAAMPDLAVLPVATGRNPPESITRFYAEAEIKSLPILRDPTQRFAHEMGVLGLPVTIIINPEGMEVARLIGDAEWDSQSALSVLDAMMPAD